MNKKLLYGKGLMDAGYQVERRSKGKLIWRCPFYQAWANLMSRTVREGRPDYYKDCTVCEEWLVFSNFKSWMERQDWEGKQLDKDLIVEGNRCYSACACVFVDSEVNSFLRRSRNRGSGESWLGVGFDKRRGLYNSTCGVGGGKNLWLGYLKTPTLAHRAWQEAKRNQAITLQSKQTCSRTKAGLQRVIDKLTQHIEQGAETKSL